MQRRKLREILFRGKSEHDGKWVEGYYCKQNETTYAFASDYERYPVPVHHFIAVDEMTDWGLPNRLRLYEIIPETVGQYTGLTDKNGKKIFEGDIVEGYFNDEKVRGYIFYGSDAQFFIQRDGLYGIFLNNAEDWLEVIGNIHDNPEMLEIAISE